MFQHLLWGLVLVSTIWLGMTLSKQAYTMYVFHNEQHRLGLAVAYEVVQLRKEVKELKNENIQKPTR